MMRSALRWGLALGAAEIAYGVLYRVASLDQVPGLAWIFYLMLPVAGFLALYHARPDGLTYRRGLGLGTLVGALGSFVYVIYVYLFNRFVDDLLLVQIRESTMATIEARGYTGARLDAALWQVETFTQPAGFSAYVFVRLAIVGTLCAAVLALFLRSRRDPETESTSGSAGAGVRASLRG